VDKEAEFNEKPIFHIKGGKPYPVIGNDVWIGQNVTLSMGIQIGDGAVVAANSMLAKSVPTCAVVGGNPAKIIKYRFTEYQREQLLEILGSDYLCTDFYQFPMDDMFTFLRCWNSVCLVRILTEADHLFSFMLITLRCHFSARNSSNCSLSFSQAHCYFPMTLRATRIILHGGFSYNTCHFPNRELAHYGH
jgi:hypothetical protein